MANAVAGAVVLAYKQPGRAQLEPTDCISEGGGGVMNAMANLWRLAELRVWPLPVTFGRRSPLPKCLECSSVIFPAFLMRGLQCLSQSAEEALHIHYPMVWADVALN